MKSQNESLDRELHLRINTIMVLRLVFLTGFVGLMLAFQQRVGFAEPIVPLSIVIALAYSFSIVYALLHKICNQFTIAVLQVIGDLFVVSGIIYTTGGIDSPLSFVYILVIIATSVMLPRAATYLVASGASILYGLLIDLTYFNVIQPVYLFPEQRVTIASGYGFYIITLHIASYYAVAYLSSILSHRLRMMREALATTSSDLQKLQAFHRNVLQDMGNGLITTDDRGLITSVNKSATEITGFDSDEIINGPCQATLNLPALEKLFVDPGSVVLPLQVEGYCRRKDGKEIFIGMKVSPLAAQDNSGKGYIFVFEDLTGMKEMQEKISQAERLAAVGRFSAGLAHEIRNPLASLSGSIQVLSKGMKLDHVNEQLMDIVTRETDRLNAILGEFLNYSQPRKNRKSLIDATQMIQEVITLMKNSDDYKTSITMDFEGQADHFVVQADEEQLKQMVWNLCINGLQAMVEKGGTLKIGLNRVSFFKNFNYSSDKAGFVLTVEDEGCGIPPDQVEKIFEPFYTTKEHGIGLGLATLYQTVQVNEGSVNVNSVPGKGTRFSIYLPQQDLPSDTKTFEPPGAKSASIHK